MPTLLPPFSSIQDQIKHMQSVKKPGQSHKASRRPETLVHVTPDNHKNIDTMQLMDHHTQLKYPSPILVFLSIDVFLQFFQVHIVIKEGLSLT